MAVEEAARVGVEVVVTVGVAKAAEEASRVGVVVTAAIGAGQPRVHRQGTELRAFCCYTSRTTADAAVPQYLTLYTSRATAAA